MNSADIGINKCALLVMEIGIKVRTGIVLPNGEVMKEIRAGLKTCEC